MNDWVGCFCSSCRYLWSTRNNIPYVQLVQPFWQLNPISSSSTHRCPCVCFPSLDQVVFICCRVWLCRFARSERLLKVLNDIVNVLSANRNTDEVVRDTAICLFLVAELLMRRCPGVNSQSLGVTNTGQRLEPLQGKKKSESILG